MGDRRHPPGDLRGFPRAQRAYHGRHRPSVARAILAGGARDGRRRGRRRTPLGRAAEPAADEAGARWCAPVAPRPLIGCTRSQADRLPARASCARRTLRATPSKSRYGSCRGRSLARFTPTCRPRCASGRSSSQTASAWRAFSASRTASWGPPISRRLVDGASIGHNQSSCPAFWACQWLPSTTIRC